MADLVLLAAHSGQMGRKTKGVALAVAAKMLLYQGKGSHWALKEQALGLMSLRKNRPLPPWLLCPWMRSQQSTQQRQDEFKRSKRRMAKSIPHLPLVHLLRLSEANDREQAALLLTELVTLWQIRNKCMITCETHWTDSVFQSLRKASEFLVYLAIVLYGTLAFLVEVKELP